MSEQNETVADIVADMRKAVAPFRIGEDELTHILCAGEVELFAARIEAAAKRERIALVAEAEAAKDARNRMGVRLRLEFAEKCKACLNGNAAKLRDALEYISSRAEVGKHFDPPAELDAVVDAARAALAAPPRNCDVGTAEEQTRRHKAFCAAHYRANDIDAQCDGCPASTPDETDCEFVWGQLPGPKCKDGMHGVPDCRGCRVHCADVRKGGGA